MTVDPWARSVFYRWDPMRVLCTVHCPKDHPCVLVYGHTERRHYCRICDTQY